ncbi:MAG: MBL fold metallo-hydrolase [Chitinophagales bacterium]|nr:MBL fold metallo-hydrolase [Chitinophagales bacterium]
MKVIFLGTGTSTGVPVIGCKCVVCSSNNKKDKRLRTSAYIDTGTEKIVIDTGPDFRQQMLNNRLDDIDAVVFTHHHKDHVGGLDDIRPVNFFHKKDIEVYAEDYVKESLEMAYPYIFQGKGYPGIPQINMHHLDETPFNIGHTLWIPIRVLHKDLPVLAFRINDFAYITDANFISEESYDKLKGVKVLAINALRKEKHYSHFSLGEALEVIDRVRPEKAYLIHIGHNMGLHEEVSHLLPKNVHIAYDGLEINI